MIRASNSLHHIISWALLDQHLDRCLLKWMDLTVWCSSELLQQQMCLAPEFSHYKTQLAALGQEEINPPFQDGSRAGSRRQLC